MRGLKIVALLTISWLAGFAAYCLVWILVYGGFQTRGLTSVAFWTAVVIAPSSVVYAAAVMKLNHSLTRKPAIFYGAACAAVGVLPLVLLNVLFGGFSVQFFSPENLLFSAYFGTAGMTFGIIYAMFLRDGATKS